VFSISYCVRTRDYMFTCVYYLVLPENKGLYIRKYLLSRNVCMCLLSRDAREQGITRLHISFISYCVRTRDYIFANIFYLVLCKNKGLYVYLYLLSRIAWEQGIIYFQISFILYCVRTRDYMFIYIFYLVLPENKGLYIFKYLLSCIV